MQDRPTWPLECDKTNKTNKTNICPLQGRTGHKFNWLFLRHVVWGDTPFERWSLFEVSYEWAHRGINVECCSCCAENHARSPSVHKDHKKKKNDFQLKKNEDDFLYLKKNLEKYIFWPSLLVGKKFTQRNCVQVRAEPGEKKTVRNKSTVDHGEDIHPSVSHVPPR